MLHRQYLRKVPLPEDLTSGNIFDALQRTQDFFTMIHENTGINLSAVIQANHFSGIVSNVFTRMLGDTSVYHPYHDQRYPDLMHANKAIGLEIKASHKPMKGGEGHNGHSGWHMIVCFAVLEGGKIEFSQVETARLRGYECEDSDWAYLGSKRNQNNSQRTETYVTTYIGTSKLRDGSVYLNPELVHITPALVRNRRKLSAALPVPWYSPFKTQP